MAMESLKSFIQSQTAKLARILRRAAPVATGGYLVVTIFALSFLLVRSRWPALRDTTVTTIALLVAGPLAIALVWHRLTGLKAFGLELSLAESTVHTSTELVAAITERQHFSGAEHILEQIRSAIVRGKTEIVEINLKGGDYWWTTRLFLLAALADDYSTIQSFAFVEMGIRRRFLGLCTPAALRKAIAQAFPTLAEVYGHLSVAQAPVGHIVHNWVAQLFDGKSELEFGGKVTAQILGD